MIEDDDFGITFYHFLKVSGAETNIIWAYNRTIITEFYQAKLVKIQETHCANCLLRIKS
jgi:hypothetical protein